MIDLQFINNQLTGSIPPELGNLTKLSELALSVNHLTGTIPIELGNLSGLTLLGLNENQLTGTIPFELNRLKKLEKLWLSNNQLHGQIPSELGELSNLQELALHTNALSGEIPSSLTKLNKLTYLTLDHNVLVATDPVLFEFLGTKDPDWQETQRLRVADFNTCNRTNNLGGQMGIASANSTVQITDTIIDDPAEPERGCRVGLAYDIQDWGTFWLDLQLIDLTRFSKLTFDIKADPQSAVSNPVEVELKRVATNKEDGIFAEQEIAKVSGLSEEWQRVSILLADFAQIDYAEPLANLTEMEQLSFTIKGTGSGSNGVVFLDNIVFEP